MAIPEAASRRLLQSHPAAGTRAIAWAWLGSSTSRYPHAALVVLGLRDGAMTELARGPHAGSTFRWLNPMGVVDFDGDGRPDVASGGCLRLADGSWWRVTLAP